MASAVGPHPSIIRVSTRYVTQALIDKKVQESAPNGQNDAQECMLAEAREASIRLQGCKWIEDVRRALDLPVKTYTSACTYFHKFRLGNPGAMSSMEHGNAWVEACAASLLVACKSEDTLKKSRDLLAAAYNLKVPPTEQLSVDDPTFELQSKNVIGVERMVLEAAGFDFRGKYPHEMIVKLAKELPDSKIGTNSMLAEVGFVVCTDMHRTWAPLKQTEVTMAFASLELGVHLLAAYNETDASGVGDWIGHLDYNEWGTSRPEIMESILDVLDLYTHHTHLTTYGVQFALDIFLRIRLMFNKECTAGHIERYASAPPRTAPSTSQVENGHPKPLSQMELATAQSTGPHANLSTNGSVTQRFMLNPQRAFDERVQVSRFFVDDWEEYEEEVEVPVQRPRSDDRRAVPSRSGVRSERVRSDRDHPSRSGPSSSGRRHDDRGYERRFEERRSSGRYDERRYEDDRRRRDDRR